MEIDKNNEQRYEIDKDLHKDPSVNALLNIAKAINNLAEAVAGSGNVKGLVDAISPISRLPLVDVLTNMHDTLGVGATDIARAIESVTVG